LEAKVKLVLASASPRRKELLKQIGVQFSVRPVDICEDVIAGETPLAYVSRLAEEKARACSIKGDEVVLGSDTTVVLDGRIIGKPMCKARSIEILKALSGKTHQVLTAVALIGKEQTNVVVVETDVTFRDISLQECESYWLTGEPIDKAGSYGIQGLGAVFVDKIEGSYSSVVGLPLSQTAELLKVAGVDIWQLDNI
tara:strand:+ start:11365 stop:11955 length:591 start_codon:yes stop_codon:yes gene_type:complete